MKRLILLLLIASATSLHAAVPGDFDPSHGVTAPGYTRTALPDSIEAHDLVLYADGAKVTSSIVDTGGTLQPALTRYKPDGSIDVGFGAAGQVIIGGMADMPNGYTQLTRYRDQLYLLVPAGAKLYVFNYDAAGVSNAAFGAGGVRIVDVGTGNAIVDIAMQKSRIIVAARMRNPATLERDFVLVGIKSNGVLDAGFGIGGIALHSLHGGPMSQEYFTGLAIAPDLRIIAGGRAAKDITAPDPYDFVVARFLPDGSVDPAFGSTAPGFSLIDFGYSDYGRRVALYANYQVLIAGSVCKTIDPATGAQYCFLGTARVRNDGLLDASWNGAGLQVSDLGNDGLVVTDVALDRRERALVSHVWYRAMGAAHLAGLSRYDFLGSLDPGFGAGGHGLYDFGYDFNGYHTVKLLDDKFVDTCGMSGKETAPGVVGFQEVVARHYNF